MQQHLLAQHQAVGQLFDPLSEGGRVGTEAEIAHRQMLPAKRQPAFDHRLVIAGRQIGHLVERIQADDQMQPTHSRLIQEGAPGLQPAGHRLQPQVAGDRGGEGKGAEWHGAILSQAGRARC